MDSSPQIVQIIRQWMDVFMHRSMSDWSRYVKSTGLSMPQFSILMHLHYKGRCGMSDVSERMDISSAAASQLVERLFLAGLVERTEDSHDRRVRQITLSPKGQALIDASIEERLRWVEYLAETLTPVEQEQVSDALGTLIEAAQRVEALAAKRTD